MPETKWLRATLHRWSGRGWGLLCGLLLVLAWGHAFLPAWAQRLGPMTAAHQGECPHNGDVTGDGQPTPADALLALQHYLGLVALSQQNCQRDQANVFDPQNSDITPADALCIFQAFLTISSCLNNRAPLAAAANASADMFINTGDLVTLDGSGSTDPDDDALRYRWTFMAVPAGSTVTDAALSAPTAAMTTFIPDVIGSYTLTLTVQDGRGGRTRASVTVEAQPPTAQLPVPCSCRGRPRAVVELSVRVTDAGGSGVRNQAVTFTRLLGDGAFEAPPPGTLRLRAGPLTAQTMAPGDTLTVRTNGDGIATAQFRLGEEPLQVVAAQARELPNDPAIFRITLGPLAGNGTEPINLAVNGQRAYTVNGGTNTISVFDTTNPAADPVAVIDLTSITTDFGAGSIRGAAVNALARRLYVYGEVATGEGGSVVLLVVDTETNALVEPVDPDGDGLPGLTLTAPLTPSATQLQSLDFGNLVTVDAGRRRVFVVVPGVTVDGNGQPDDNAPGSVIVLEERDNALFELQRVAVGLIPTGVAVNPVTNRIYVTNRGFVDPMNDTMRDSVTVIRNDNDDVFTVSATIPVGHVPLGVTLDDVHDIIYVANLFGETLSDPPMCCGSVSVINGATNTVLQTIPTAGIGALAVLVGARTTFLDPALDRVFLSDGTVIECNVTDLTVPAPCQERADLQGVQGKLAINDSHTQLFGARRFDNAVTVLDLASRAVSTTRTGVTVAGLAVDAQNGTIYASDFHGNRLFAVAPNGSTEAIDLHAMEIGFARPGQVEVDAANGRVYVITTNFTGGPGASPPLVALDRSTRGLVATLQPDEWNYGFPQALGIDPMRNLLYISTASNLLVVLDGTRLSGATTVSAARLAEVVAGRDDGCEVTQGIAVDVARNLVYVTRWAPHDRPGCEPSRNALVVVQGPEFVPASRELQRSPAVLTDIANIGVPFVVGRRIMALDPQRHLLYVAGVADARAIMVLDGLQIVDLQGQVTSNPAAAVLGFIPIRVPPDLTDTPGLTVVADQELAFDASQGVLYSVARTTARATAGFIAAIHSALVIDGARQLRRDPHPTIPEALRPLLATIPAGIAPEFLVVDAARQRMVVTNQSSGLLSVLRTLTVQ